MLALRRQRDLLQTRVIRSNTRRQIYIAAAALPYLYFLGDAALNYAYNDSPVKRATTLSCIFPGAGQVYNKSYWKLPFVVGGLATTIYVIDWNNRGYKRFKKVYELRSEWERIQADPTIPTELKPAQIDEFAGSFDSNFFRDLKDSYRRNRDLSIIITAGLYLLQIVDAHVDAHLKDFDISDDLAADFSPMIDYAYSPRSYYPVPTFGMRFTLKF